MGLAGGDLPGQFQIPKAPGASGSSPEQEQSTLNPTPPPRTDQLAQLEREVRLTIDDAAASVRNAIEAGRLLSEQERSMRGEPGLTFQQWVAEQGEFPYRQAEIYLRMYDSRLEIGETVAAVQDLFDRFTAP